MTERTAASSKNGPPDRSIDGTPVHSAGGGAACSARASTAYRSGDTLFSQFASPVLVLHDAAARHNIALMAQYCHRHGLAIAPHAKTTMTPYLINLQLAAGAWGMTAASMRQTQDLVQMGVQRILLANEMVEYHDVEWLARHLEASEGEGDFVCYVDSIDGLSRLESHLARASASPPAVGVLVELGYPAGRTGTRSVEGGMAVARAVAGSQHLTLRGIAGYEGLLPRGTGRRPPGLNSFLAKLAELTRACHAEDLFERIPIVSAGGSSYFDVVTDHLKPDAFDFDVVTILRSGCYVVHDHGLYKETSPLDGPWAGGNATFAPALELVATVTSRPEDQLAIVNFGRRHVPTDDRLPIPLSELLADGSHRPVPDAQVRRVDDEHCYLAVPPTTTVGPGDRLRFGISHPCGAFDRWRAVPVVDEQYRVLDVAHPTF